MKIYWKKEINSYTIAAEKTQDIINNIINLFFVLLAIAGILSLAHSIYLNDFNFFAARNNYLLLFWISLVGDLFIYYRFDQQIKKKYKLSKIKDDNVNIANYFNKEAIYALQQAYLLARKNQQQEILGIDVLAEITKAKNIRVILLRLGLNFENFKAKIERVILKTPKQPGKNLVFSKNLKKALEVAFTDAYEHHREEVTVTDLLLGLASSEEIIKNIFDDLNVDMRKLHNVVDWIFLNDKLLQWSRQYHHRAQSKPKTSMNRAMTARPTALLDKVSQDYTLKAKYNNFFPLVGREKEVAEAFRVLKEGTGNVMLVGDAGVGKTTILEGVAQLMVAEDVPANLQDKRLVIIDPGVLIAGAGGIGGVEQRMVQIIYEVMLAGNVILAIEDIHSLLGARSTGSEADVGRILMNFLSQGYIKVIGTTTTQEYQKYIVDKEPFLRRFQVVKINEMTIDEGIRVLEARSGFLEFKYKVFFSYEAIEAAVSLTDRYIKDRHLPAKALDVLEEAAIYAHEQNKNIVTREEVAVILSEKTNVALTSITESEADKLLNLEEIMHQRIVGQDEAVEAVAKALRRAREEIRDTTRPIANFLFLGSTGVGKTETAKTIAEVYFGNEKNMVRLDMSEYQDKASIYRLLGTPDSAGYLTEAIMQKPFSLILLDEIEKAHPDILNLFLQVMEDGRLTDGRGKTIDFTNSIIVATSNAATKEINMGQQQGLRAEEIYQGLMDGFLEKYFRVEFINRFDRIVVFRSLTVEDTVDIAKRMLNKLAQTLLVKGITFQYSEQAAQELAQNGYNPQFGARPLRRLIQDTVDDALAKLMLQQKISRRDVIVLEAGGNLRIQKAQPI
jgi:ATP-dependent Clp protease ATP-binding subunit ClpC